MNLIPKASDAVDQAASRGGLSKTDTINRAVQIYDYLDGLVAEGAEILVRQPGKDELTLLRWF